jgi:hypothetical protein
MEPIGALYFVVTFFLILAGILALMMPFFVFRIRNELILMNKKMSQLIEILSGVQDVAGERAPIEK